MTTQDFLELLVPQDGVLFTATQATGKGWINTPHTTVEQAVRATEQLTLDGRNAYFALASFKEARVWDAAARNADGTVGRWRTRVQSNAKSLKAFWVDLDVELGDAKKFSSKEECITDLKSFCKVVGLPRPMVIDSGGGIHAYWPLAEAVTVAQWKPVAQALKQITVELEFKCDQSLTADEARVLRTLGGYNFRRSAPVQLLSAAGPYAFADIERTITGFHATLDAPLPPRSPLLPGSHLVGLPPAPPSADDGNLGATNDPLHFDRIAFSCAQIGIQAGCRGAGISEPLWHAAIGIAKFCDPQSMAAAAISDGHANYSPAATRIKLDNWNAGPTTCEKFRVANRAICDACPHYGQITSPAQLGRAIHEAPAPTVAVQDHVAGVIVEQVIPDPPAPYKRRKSGGVVIESEDKEGNPTYVPVCPYDLYPIKIMRQQGEDAAVDERSVWRAHLPRLGAVDMDVQQSLLSDSKRLFAYLLAKGLYMSPDESKATQQYMSAYLQTLATATDREKLYERLGWHDDRSAFVLGERVIHKDGTSTAHVPGKTLLAVTKGGVHTAGTLDAWKQAIQFYGQPNYEGHRMFLYAALAAPIFHMTGHKGVLMTASGESGRGKTTCLKACASLWGDPEHLIMNGNKDGATTNALYEHLGTYHSLPFLLDDTTERDPEEIRRMMLNLSQGMGKERMKGSEHSGHSVRWETIVQSTANTDDMNRIMAGSKDVEPHLMRFISVEFQTIDTSPEAKINADRFLRALHQNFGHVGPLFMGTVVANYDKIRGLVERNMDMITRRVDSDNSSAERLWLACIAATYTAAQLANTLGLFSFPIATDLDWMVRHLGVQRESIRESKSTPTELLSTFLEQHFGHALILSARQSSNLDNVSHRPVGQLHIRHELDAGTMYVARNAIIDYCAQIKIPFRKFEQQLIAEKVLLATNKQKVLGADTIFAKGQTRCWLLDAAKLGGAQSLAEQAIARQQAEDAAKKAKAPASNVVPITKAAA
jgi:hypothetical protein